MPRYSQDPRWIDARYAGKCSECNAPIKRDERCFYYPNGKKLLSGECAEAAAGDFNACAFDEAQYTGSY